MPNIFKMIVDATEAGLGFLANGMKIVSPEEQKKRMDICRGCDEFDQEKTKCKNCGCYLNVKTWMANTKCPLNPPKWEENI